MQRHFIKRGVVEGIAFIRIETTLLVRFLDLGGIDIQCRYIFR